MLISSRPAPRTVRNICKKRGGGAKISKARCYVAARGFLTLRKTRPEIARGSRNIGAYQSVLGKPVIEEFVSSARLFVSQPFSRVLDTIGI